MNALKLDTTSLRFRVDAVEQKRDVAGNPVLDRETQQPKFTVHLTVRIPDRARPDQWSVTIVGQPKIAVDQYVVPAQRRRLPVGAGRPARHRAARRGHRPRRSRSRAACRCWPQW